jgi:hypothetical protein
MESLKQLVDISKNRIFVVQDDENVRVLASFEKNIDDISPFLRRRPPTMRAAADVVGVGSPTPRSIDLGIGPECGGMM